MEYKTAPLAHAPELVAHSTTAPKATSGPWQCAVRTVDKGSARDHFQQPVKQQQAALHVEEGSSWTFQQSQGTKYVGVYVAKQAFPFVGCERTRRKSPESLTSFQTLLLQMEISGKRGCLFFASL